jgi:DNA-binding HxlR family transcriptional regulator
MVPVSVPVQACMIVEDGRTYCIDPLEEVLQVLSRRWGLLTIAVLGNRGSLQFNEAKRTIPGITARALADRLRDLQEHGLATRHVDATASPPTVSYRLTKRGRELRRALLPLIQWAGDEVTHDDD